MIYNAPSGLRHSHRIAVGSADQEMLKSSSYHSVGSNGLTLGGSPFLGTRLPWSSKHSSRTIWGRKLRHTLNRSFSTSRVMRASDTLIISFTGDRLRSSPRNVMLYTISNRSPGESG